MNNVGVAALMLPVVMDIGRRTNHPPSKLLIPLAFGSLLGGLTTLIGTPPNILISDTLRDYGLNPFQMFDFAPVGIAVMLTGTAFMVLVGRHLLPTRDIAREFSTSQQTDLGEFYDLHEQLFVVNLPSNSTLVNRSLHDSRLGAALGLNVVAIIRDGHTQLAPKPETILLSDDRLVVQGPRTALADLLGRRQLAVESHHLEVEELTSPNVEFAEARLAAASTLIGRTISQIGFRGRFGVNVLAIQRNGVISLTGLKGISLQAGDTLLLQGPEAQLADIQSTDDFDQIDHISEERVTRVYNLQNRLVAVEVAPDSAMVDRTLVETRLGEAFGLTVLGIIRGGTTQLMPQATEKLQAGDFLLIKGNPEGLLALRGLEELEIDQVARPDLSELESERVGMAEVVLSPHTTLADKSLRQLHFRPKYGLSVLAIWRSGQAHRTDLRDLPLHFGDALLLYGPRQRLSLLGDDPDFLVLTEAIQPALMQSKAPIAVLIMVGMLLPVILGWLPIAIAAVVGATAMILTGCLTMEEAYRFIEWRAVFLIAGMLPLGIAMERTGAASFLAEQVVAVVGGLGPSAIVISLFFLAALTSQVMPNPAVAVLLAPIAFSTATELGISPYALLMTVAISTSASFLSPVAHPANLLVLGPGGYRFTDYIKVGLPLTLVVLLTVLLVLPIFWPLVP
jgi:di/tricarboxylate transporter